MALCLRVALSAARYTERRQGAVTRKSIVLLLSFVLVALCPGCANDPDTRTAFVHRCAGSDSRLLCLHSQEVRLMSGSVPGTGAPSQEIALAHALKRNTINVINFQSRYRDLFDAKSENTWRRIDLLLAQAAVAKPPLHVMLTLSEFAKDLVVAGVNPLTALSAWDGYIDFIANRRNTVNGVEYKNDPTIAMVQIWGEPCYVGENDGAGSDCPATITTAAGYNTANMRTFYEHVLDRWRRDAPRTLVSTGGLSHLNGTDNPPGVMNGIPWRDLMSYPTNATCDIEINSNADYDSTVAKVANFCSWIGKPWFLSAWSSCYQDPTYAWRPVMQTDNEMAAHNTLMFNTIHAAKGTPAAYHAVGTSFWSMTPYPTVYGVPLPGHCDQDATTFPIAAQAIKNNAF